MGHLNSAVVMAAKSGTLGDLANHGTGGFIVATVVVVLIVLLIVGFARLTRGRKNKG